MVFLRPANPSASPWSPVLGRRDPQCKLFSAAQQLGEAAIKKLGFYVRLATEGYKVFRDEDFIGAYCEDNGRPSVPPYVLIFARLLQHHDCVSDAEVLVEHRYDIRCKVAMDLDLASIAQVFAKSTFQAFRARWVAPCSGCDIHLAELPLPGRSS